jgi:AraC-like DNA-binding protein
LRDLRWLRHPPEKFGGWVEQIIFDARELPPAEAFDRWRIGVTDFDLSLRNGSRPFDGVTRITSLGQVLISESDFPALRFLRTAEKAAADGHDMWSLSLVLTGGMEGDADGTPFRIRPQQIALFTHARPADILTEPGKTIALAIPAALLPGVDPERQHGRLEDGPATALLAGFLQRLCVALPALDDAQALPLMRALLALIQAAAPNAEGVTMASRRTLKLRDRVIDHLRERLDQPLSAEAVCADLGVSKSALYRALTSDGGLQGLVRRLRLQEAHRLLLDPDESRTIQQIAAALGYLDQSVFSRHFHAVFGYTAAELRSRPAPPAPIPPGSNDIPRDFAKATNRLSARR